MYCLFQLLDVSVGKYGTVYPIRQAVYDGSKGIDIHCYSYRLVTWSWKIKQFTQYNHLLNVLRLEEVTSQHTGIYTCCGTLENGLEFTAQSELLVGG